MARLMLPGNMVCLKVSGFPLFNTKKRFKKKHYAFVRYLKLFCFQHVVMFWKSLKWPDPVDSYTIALRMTNDVSSAVETYAEHIHRKLRNVGFFDEEGQFDVTEELCLTLNNLQVKDPCTICSFHHLANV